MPHRTAAAGVDARAAVPRLPVRKAVERALLVDPDADTRALYKAALEPFTAEIAEAEDGAEALGKAICDRPSLILTETRLPRMDGYALCTLLRRDDATSRARIVVVTGAASQMEQKRASAAGADAVLVKPCAIEELIATVQRLCAAPIVARREPADAPAAQPDLIRRIAKSHAHERRFTTTPPRPAPLVFCPNCATPLAYRHSYTGGVSDQYPEQWDYFECHECGMYRYRHRTRRLTLVEELGTDSAHR
jgi:CheY-like chemotaxis protein